MRSQPSLSVDGQMCAAWQSQMGTDVQPEVFWEACRLLSSEGWVIGNYQELAAREIGPFRFASVKSDQEALTSFIEALFPAALTAVATGDPAGAVAGGIAVFLSQVFCHMMRSSTLVDDPFAWAVLMAVRRFNQKGIQPKRGELSSSCLQAAKRLGLEDTDVQRRLEESIGRLKISRALMGKKVVELLAEGEDGKLHCSV